MPNLTPSLLPMFAVLQKWAKLAGCDETPPQPTENMIGSPFAVVYFRSADITLDPGPAERDLVTVFHDMHFNRVDLPTDFLKVVQVYEDFKWRFRESPTIEDTIAALDLSKNPIHVEFGRLEIGTMETLGLRWSFTVKLQDNQA